MRRLPRDNSLVVEDLGCLFRQLNVLEVPAPYFPLTFELA